MPTFITPSGWKPWIYADNVINNIQYPDASFPYLYVPSRGFWARSIANHCLIPWLNCIDPFDAFLIAGGSSPSLAGLLGALSVVKDLFDIANHSQTFGIGRSAPAPQAGYCIGNKFKQQVYTTIDVTNDGSGGTIVTNIGVELLQNFRFKRAYVDHGSVVRHSVLNNGGTQEYVLTLDIVKTNPPPTGLSFSGDTINIIKSGNSSSSSTTISVNILGIKNNWDFIISQPPQDISYGDYYKFSSPLCIEDPYLLSGFWVGNENSVSPPIPSSGLGLYVTSHNSPYQKGKFLGNYIWKTDPPTTSDAISSNVASQPITGYSMDDANGYSWAFIGFGNSPEYPVYPNDTRYREIQLDSVNSLDSMVEFKERLVASSSDYTTLIESNPSYLRVEIGTGGYNTRHNWYAPCLKGEYINTDGKLYKILNQVSFNIIDVSLLSVDGVSKFNPKTNQEYVITNQYGWFLNEHYDLRISSGNNTGVFKGGVQSILNNTKFTVLTDGDTYASRVKKNGLSFIDRYQKNISLTSSLKKCFEKNTGWKLVAGNNKEYSIKSVDFSSAIDQQYTPYPISVELVNATTDIKNGDRVYIAFDNTFETFGNDSKESGYSFSASFSPDPTGANDFITSTALCIDGEFFSAPYKINISSDDRIGFCEGYLFGLGANGSAQSIYSQTMFITVPGTSVGTSAIFNGFRQEDWVAFVDPVTDKITIRRGSLDFTEYPKKEMVTIGNSYFVSSSSNPISLDTKYSMTKKLEVLFGDDLTGNDMGILFGVGSLKNTYGFYVSGDGVFNLKLFERQGALPGSIPSDKYTGYGYDVSPVYLYRPSYFSNLNPSTINVGVKTSDGPIYLIGSNSSSETVVSNVSIEYVKDFQTLSQTGYYDIVKIKDGEILLIYGANQGAFNLISNSASSSLTLMLNNSENNDSKWSNPNAVMILGTYNDSWCAPLTNGQGDNQYPLMVLNDVDYLSSLYSPFQNTISIFVRCMDSQNNIYLGCYTMLVSNITHANFLCNSSSSTVSSNFLWKPTLLPDVFINDEQKSWEDSNSIINDGYSFIASNEKILPDTFVRVMGPSSTNSQIIDDNDFGIVSPNILNDGSYVVFYDSLLGIKMIFSNNAGVSWYQSNIVFYKDAKNAIMVGNCLFAIVVDGIETKFTELADFYNAINIGLMQTGIDRINKEIELQGIIDKKRRILIGSGRVESQRLSGYITPSGVMKIFFYDQKNLLKCMESINRGSLWSVANNF